MQRISIEDLQENAQNFDIDGGSWRRTICEWESWECLLSYMNHVYDYSWGQLRKGLSLLSFMLEQALLKRHWWHWWGGCWIADCSDWAKHTKNTFIIPWEVCFKFQYLRIDWQLGRDVEGLAVL